VRHFCHQGFWLPHRIRGSEGAKILHDEKLFDAIVPNGTEVEFESYSWFQDDGGTETSLHLLLQAEDIECVIIYGIAIDYYCARANSLGAVALGYRVVMVKDLSRGVAPETTKKAIGELQRAGVQILESVDFFLLTYGNIIVINYLIINHIIRGE
jgi:nicotinamidase/pyrazinamidase